MRIIQITPGTGNFHCGHCLRDVALVKELRRRGHDAVCVPLYLPLLTEQDDPSDGRIFMSFHFMESNANVLTNTALDPICKIPEYKVCAVRVEKIEEEAAVG